MAGGAQGEAVVEAARLLELPLLLMPRSEWATYGEGFAERAYVTHGFNNGLRYGIYEGGYI